MRFRSLALVALAVAAAAQPSAAQSLPTLPRALTTTGVNDSALFLVSDSARRTRAVSGAQLKLLFAGGGGSADSIMLKNGTAGAPSLKFANSTTTGLFRAAADAIGVSVAGGEKMRFTSTMLEAQTGSYVLSMGAGTAAAPTFSFGAAGSAGLGLYRFGADTLGIATAGAESFRWHRQGIVKLAAGAGAQSCATPALGLYPGANGGSSSNTGIVFDTTNTGRVRICDDGTTAMTFGSGAISIGASNGIRCANASASSPCYQFTNGNNSGMYLINNGSSDTLSLAANGLTGFKLPTRNVWVGGAIDSLMIVPGNPGVANLATTIMVVNGSNALERAAKFWANGTANGQLLMAPGSSATAAGSPNYSFIGDFNSGMYWAGADTVGITTGGSSTVRFLGGAAATILGGAGNMTIQPGTGNARRINLQATTNTGTVVTSLVVDTNVTVNNGPGGSGTGQLLLAGGGSASWPNLAFSADRDVGLNRAGADTLDIVTAGSVRARWANNAATAAGDVSVCLTTTGVTNVIRTGATCGTSSSKVKTDINSIFSPTKTLMALRPVSYSYIPSFYGGRAEYGLLADEAMQVDPKLVYTAPSDEALPNGLYIKKGEALNVNDRAVLSLLIATVQQQQRQIDSLRAAIKK